MRAAVFAYSRQGCRTAGRVLSALSGEELRAYTMERFSEPGFLPLGRPARGFYGELFSSSDALVFVGSCGIAVREIAPHVKDKRTDPAVICIDELGRYVIPLLSGHIGGANELARRLASALGAEAVVTTATDINNRFSVDAWAAKQGFVIDDMAAAKAVSAAVLERAVPLSSDFPVAAPYPAGTEPGSSGELGICISFVKKSPFKRTLRLIPRILHLGIGCRRGTPAGAIAAVRHRPARREVRGLYRPQGGRAGTALVLPGKRPAAVLLLRGGAHGGARQLHAVGVRAERHRRGQRLRARRALRSLSAHCKKDRLERRYCRRRGREFGGTL